MKVQRRHIRGENVQIKRGEDDSRGKEMDEG